MAGYFGPNGFFSSPVGFLVKTALVGCFLVKVSLLYLEQKTVSHVIAKVGLKCKKAKNASFCFDKTGIKHYNKASSRYNIDMTMTRYRTDFLLLCTQFSILNTTMPL